MSDHQEREPIDQATIDCWRVNYGLDTRTPAQAAQWWCERAHGMAPAGAVAALGIALDALEAAQKDAALVRAQALADAARACEQIDDIDPGLVWGERCAAAIRALL